MDKAEIDENGNPKLFCGKADVSLCEKIKGQKNVYLLEVLAVLDATQISSKPGQFYLVKSQNSSVQFGRPISVYNSTEGFSTDGKKLLKIKFLILEKGEGTKELCHLKVNDKVELIGPLGNSFEIPQDIKKEPSRTPEICIVGGGIGVAPVINFASTLHPKIYDFYASFKSGTYGLENIAPSNLIITTDDGSFGIKGMLPNALSVQTLKEKNYKVIFACGPTPMLSYVKKIAQEAGIKAYLSLEKKMLCGVGACLGCTIKTKLGNKRVCKDGPIFDSEIIDFPEQSKPHVKVQSASVSDVSEKFSENNDFVDLSVEIAGVHFENPVIAASGTFGFGQNYRSFFDVNLLGGICSKGLTLEPKSGNEGERILEVASGDINSIGLENPGVPHFIEYELPEMLKLKPVIIANLAGSDLESYVKGAELLDKTNVPMIELNISCPNVRSGGMAWGIDCVAAGECVKAVRKATSKPLIVKLSPNAPDLIGVAMACIKEGADALSLINTIQATAINIETARPVFNNIRAGLCGPAIKPIALRMVYDLVQAINKLPANQRVPVIGLGGISKWQDAVEFMMAGASAIQVGTASFSNPKAMLEIIDGLKNFMKSHGYKNISQLCGLAQ